MWDVSEGTELTSLQHQEKSLHNIDFDAQKSTHALVLGKVTIKHIWEDMLKKIHSAIIFMLCNVAIQPHYLQKKVMYFPYSCDLPLTDKTCLQLNNCCIYMCTRCLGRPSHVHLQLERLSIKHFRAFLIISPTILMICITLCCFFFLTANPWFWKNFHSFVSGDLWIHNKYFK